jgi:cytochrome c-type biogenesis protein CcmE
MRRIPHVKFLVAGALIVGTICYLIFSGISDSMVYYYTVSELKAQKTTLAGKGIRVNGHVLGGSIHRSKDGTRVDFAVLEKATNETLQVTYEGLIPDTFKDNAEVVVEGIYNPGDPSFQATTLLAKCPSKYQALGDEHPGEPYQTERSYSVQ